MKPFTYILLLFVLVFGASGCSPAIQNNTSVSSMQVSITQTLETASPAPSPAQNLTPTPAPTPSPEIAPSPDPSLNSSEEPIILDPKEDLAFIESVGPVRLDMTESQLVAALGKPDKSKSDVMNMEGGQIDVTTWTYKAKGYSIKLTKVLGSEDEPTIWMFTVNELCKQMTKRGIKVGDTEEAVKKAYNDVIDEQMTDYATGSIMAGGFPWYIEFTIKKSIVTSIFIGPVGE